MADPSKKLYASDEEVLNKMVQENEYSDISERKYSSDTEMNVKILSCEQSGSSEEEENVSNNSSMLHDIGAKSGAE
jgi:hypothetical protein